MIAHNKFLDFLKVIEVLEDSIFEDSVEFVLKARQHRILLVDIQAKSIERCIPIQCVQIQKLKVVDDLRHASLHFRFVQELLLFQRINGFRQLDMSALEPWETTLKSRTNEEEAIDEKVNRRMISLMRIIIRS